MNHFVIPTPDTTLIASPNVVQPYLKRVDPALLETFDEQQLATIQTILESTISKPSPKLIDLRLTADLAFTRFYIVLLVGKDKRRTARSSSHQTVSYVVNIAVAVCLLITLNFSISAFIFLTAYLIKSTLGIDLFPFHLKDLISTF